MAEESRMETLNIDTANNAPAANERRVSIGMPVFNCAPYIRRAIESILGQTHREFELIISDNASTDGTSEICREYAARDGRIRYIRQNENIGATNNFKFVLHEARHELFIWAAGDDWWDADRLEKLIGAFTGQTVSVLGEIVSYYKHLGLLRRFSVKTFRRNQILRFIVNEEARGEKVFYIYGLGRASDFRWASECLEDKYAADAIFCYRLLQRGDLRQISGARLHSTVRLDSEGARTTARSIMLSLFLRFPLDYYWGYFKNTKIHLKGLCLLALIIKFTVSPSYIWFRALYKLTTGEAFMYGRVERVVPD